MLLQAAGSDVGSGSQGCEWGFVLATPELPPCLAGSSMVALGKGSGTTSRGRPVKDSASFISHNVYYVKQLAAAARYHADLLSAFLIVVIFTINPASH